MSGPAQNVYDVIVIGAGPVGYTVADRVRAAELSMAAVERELVESFNHETTPNLAHELLPGHVVTTGPRRAAW
jgi:flavin-dependent dehydrogenase